METQSRTVTHRRGHNAIVTGLAMLVLGVVFALAFTTEHFMGSLAVVVAFAGFITLIVGFGIRREHG